MLKTCRILPATLLSIASLGCFDYEEAITLNEDFSGTVALKYDVPLIKMEDGRYRSLLAHLPFKRPKIKEKFTSDDSTVKILRRKVIPAEKRKPPTGFKDLVFLKLYKKVEYYGRVKIMINFSNIFALQKILPGEIDFKETGEGFRIVRTLSGNTLSYKNLSMNQKTLLRYLRRFFRNKAYQLSLALPPDYKIPRHNCTQVKKGDRQSCAWTVPMDDLLAKYPEKQLFLEMEK